MTKINLMYHDVVSYTDGTSGFQNIEALQYKVDCQLFEAHLKTIEGGGGRLTFDDGGISAYTCVAPLLEKYDLIGIFFIPTAYIDKPGFLTRNQIVELHRRGHIIGSHSHTHPVNMTSLDYMEICSEWKTSLEILSNIIGERIDVASVPNGYTSKNILKAAKECGINVLYTSEPTDNVSSQCGMTIYGRYVIHDKATAEDVAHIVNSKKFRWLRHFRWRLIEMAKIVLGPLYGPLKKYIVH